MHAPRSLPATVSRIVFCGLVAATVWVAGCQDAPLAPDIDPSLAKTSGGGGGGGAQKDPTVSSTDPTEAPQDTTLDVHVFGSNYATGDAVTLLLAGTATDKVKTNSTRYVSSRELVANVTIAVDATVALYDVQVASLNGRRGIGTEMFTVKPGGGPPSSPPVTSTIANEDVGIAPALQIRSDGLGAYTNTNTLSDLGVDWVIDALNPQDATRQLYLDFSQPIPGTGPGGSDPVGLPSPQPSVLVAFRMISRCSQNGQSFLDVAPGATVYCPLHVRFYYAGGDYAVEMSPLPGYAPGTDFASVTCVNPTSGSGPCTAWRITPSGTWSGGYRNNAELIRYAKVKGKTEKVDEGHFYMSFRIDITSP